MYTKKQIDETRYRFGGLSEAMMKLANMREQEERAKRKAEKSAKKAR